jgi:glutamyl-Q tRNA(Asp) synthetase
VSGAAVVTRFAPSPTGYLHRGHAFSALTAYENARTAGGRFLLRIEDIDAGRCRPEFTEAILEDLAWLGLLWEPPVRVQSNHLADYKTALASLSARGLIYRCFKTRREALDAMAQAPHGTIPAVFGAPLDPAEESKRLADGRPFAWRLSIAAAERALGGFEQLTFVDQALGETPADPWRAGDVILARKDIGVAYHLAVVVDDAAQGVTRVVRGLDLLEATHVQRLLQALLGLPTPAYHHHRLILRPDGKRFAKRDTTETLRALRAAGVTPEALRAELGV